jgi:hypothetical protein
MALEQICQIAIDGYVAFSARVRRSRKPASEKLREIIELHLSTLNHRPSFLKVFQENRKELGNEARRKIGRQIREYEQAIEGIFRQGVRDGVFRADLDALHATLTLLAACNAVSVWWQVRSSAPIPEIATGIADMLLCGAFSRVVPRRILPARLFSVPPSSWRGGLVRRHGACSLARAFHTKREIPIHGRVSRGPFPHIRSGAGRLAWDRHERRGALPRGCKPDRNLRQRLWLPAGRVANRSHPAPSVRGIAPVARGLNGDARPSRPAAHPG